jgi:hypothetical protein
VVVRWPINEDLKKFGYERGEGRFKHKWKHDRAGFVPTKHGPTGKCHSSITEEVAVALLRSGFVEASPYEDSPGAPDMIYNVYAGVPYVAVATTPGKTYHGYPWAGRMSASIKEVLRARAMQEGTVRIFERWIDTYWQSG